MFETPTERPTEFACVENPLVEQNDARTQGDPDTASSLAANSTSALSVYLHDVYCRMQRWLWRLRFLDILSGSG